MSYTSEYARINFVDDSEPALSADNLNQMDETIAKLDAYMPKVDEKSAVAVIPIKTSGERIASITVDGVTKNIYASAGGGTGGETTADAVSYDNTESGLSAGNVQEAIDEMAGNIAGTMKSALTVTETLAAGSTDLQLYDDSITTSSIIDIYVWVETGTLTENITYTGIKVEAGVITLYFDEQDVDLKVGARIS